LPSSAELLGLGGGFLVAVGYVPQIVRVWRLRDAREISLPFNVLSLSGTALWLAYGLALGLLSVILWNSVNCVLLSLLLVVKLKFGMGPRGGSIPESRIGPALNNRTRTRVKHGTGTALLLPD